MDDRKIIDLYWRRSETAIGETANKYARYCHSISFNILHDMEDAEEWAKPEQGITKNGNFIGGRKEANGNWVFLSASYGGEDEAAVPLEWGNPLRLEYIIKDGKVMEIYFSRSFESN